MEKGTFFPWRLKRHGNNQSHQSLCRALTAELVQLACAHLGTAGSPWYFSAGSHSPCSSGFWWVPYHHGYVYISLLKPPLTPPPCCLSPLRALLPLSLHFLVLTAVSLSPGASLLQHLLTVFQSTVFATATPNSLLTFS